MASAVGREPINRFRAHFRFIVEIMIDGLPRNLYPDNLITLGLKPSHIQGLTTQWNEYLRTRGNMQRRPKFHQHRVVIRLVKADLVVLPPFQPEPGIHSPSRLRPLLGQPLHTALRIYAKDCPHKTLLGPTSCWSSVQTIPLFSHLRTF